MIKTVTNHTDMTLEPLLDIILVEDWRPLEYDTVSIGNYLRVFQTALKTDETRSF